MPAGKDHIERLITSETAVLVDRVRTMGAVSGAGKLRIDDVFTTHRRRPGPQPIAAIGADGLSQQFNDDDVFMLDVDGVRMACWFLSGNPVIREAPLVFGPLMGYYLIPRTSPRPDSCCRKVEGSPWAMVDSPDLGVPSLVRMESLAARVGGSFRRTRFANQFRMSCDPKSWPLVRDYAARELVGKWSSSFLIVLDEPTSRSYYLELTFSELSDAAMMRGAEMCGAFI